MSSYDPKKEDLGTHTQNPEEYGQRPQSPRGTNLPDLSDEEIIDELNDAIRYLSNNPEEIQGIKTSDDTYWVSVPEIVNHTEIYGNIDEELMEDIDTYTCWLSGLSGSKNVDNVNRFKKDFENDTFGERYFEHQKNQTDAVHDLPAGEGTDIPHIKIPDAEEIL